MRYCGTLMLPSTVTMTDARLAPRRWPRANHLRPAGAQAGNFGSNWALANEDQLSEPESPKSSWKETPKARNQKAPELNTLCLVSDVFFLWPQERTHHAPPHLPRLGSRGWPPARAPRWARLSAGSVDENLISSSGEATHKAWIPRSPWWPWSCTTENHKVTYVSRLTSSRQQCRTQQWEGFEA